MKSKMMEGGCGANMKHTGTQLTDDDKNMIMSALQPMPAPLPDDQRRHAFIMVGNETLFLVHMTMFHMEEHCYQIILRARLPEADMDHFRALRKRNPKKTYFLANLTESALDIPQLASGEMTSFEAEIYAGIPKKKEYTEWPWSGIKPVFHRVRAYIERVVYYRHFDYNFNYPNNLTYVLFGSGNEAHMQSFQTKEPDYDHILSLKTVPYWLPANKLETAVTVNFPDMPNRPVRLTNPLAEQEYEVEYQGFRKYLGFTFSDRHLIEVGTTWWFGTSPLNLIPPAMHEKHGTKPKKKRANVKKKRAK